MSEALRQVVWKCDRCGGDAQAIFGIFPSCKCGSTSFKAAQPPAPTAQPARTLLEQYDLDQSPEYRKGYEDGRLKGFEVGQRYAREAAQPVQQPGAEPDEFLGLPFNEAKTRILALDAESARGMAISFMIQLGLLQKYAAPAQRQPLSEVQIHAMKCAAADQGITGIAPSLHLARAVEAAHGITAVPEEQK